MWFVGLFALFESLGRLDGFVQVQRCCCDVRIVLDQLLKYRSPHHGSGYSTGPFANVARVWEQ